MANTEKEYFWKERQQHLRKLRNGSGPKANIGKQQYTRNKAESPNAHSPYGKYRRNSSPYLPELSTPPEHEKRSKPKNIRGNRYEVVPPVRPKQAFTKAPRRHRSPDYDSWGEDDSDYSDDEVRPQPYAYPMTVVYGHPFPGYFYPPPPRGSRRKKGKQPSSRAIDREVRFTSPDKPRKNQINNRKRSEPVRNGYRRSRPREDLFDPDQNDILQRYQYIYPGNYDDPEETAEEDMHYYVKDHPVFAADLVEKFVADTIEEDLIPDLLIDALVNYNSLPKEHPYYVPSGQVGEDILRLHLDDMGRDVVRETLGEMADGYLNNQVRDPTEHAAERLIRDVVMEQAYDIVRDATKELAEDYLQSRTLMGAALDVIADYVDDVAPEVVEDVMFEVITEEFIKTEVIEPEVKDEARDVANEIIEHYDNRILRHEYKEISKQGRDRLADSVMLDYLLALITRQGRVWTESDHANKHMDGLMLNILLEQFMGVRNDRSKTLENNPMKKLHEKVITDVALDVILKQLTASLDEDLADVDEYDRGADLTIHPPSSLR